jgi:hypothetical protein
MFNIARSAVTSERLACCHEAAVLLAPPEGLAALGAPADVDLAVARGLGGEAIASVFVAGGFESRELFVCALEDGDAGEELTDFRTERPAPLRCTLHRLPFG